MLDTTSLYADPGMGTLSTNVMIKMLPQQGCQENLMLHTYYLISHPNKQYELDAIRLNTILYHWNFFLSVRFLVELSYRWGEVVGVLVVDICLFVPV